MLRKDQRLNLKYSFKWVASGQRLDTPLCKIFWRAEKNTQPLVSITSSSKIFKLAVDRNRARRLASTAIQELYPRLSPNSNIVIMPKQSILTSSSISILKELEASLVKARILK